MDINKARENMITQQIRPYGISNEKILNIFYKIKRENFIVKKYKHLAFSELEIPLINNEYMFTPCIEARILQELKIKKNEKILEIGTGSGYMTALLANQSYHVSSIDIIPKLTKFAKKNLNKNNINNVTIITNSFLKELKNKKKYDIILISGSIQVIPKKILKKINDYGKIFIFHGKFPITTAKIIIKNKNNFKIFNLFETYIKSLNINK